MCFLNKFPDVHPDGDKDVACRFRPGVLRGHESTKGRAGCEQKQEKPANKNVGHFRNSEMLLQL